MHESVRRLLDILPAGEGIAEDIDWQAVREHFGCDFPDDYVDFMSIYGPGAINNSFYIGSPSLAHQGPADPVFIADLTSDGLYLLDAADSDGLGLAWAGDCSGSHIFWNAKNNDPNMWTISVVSRAGERTEFDYGMADFLIYLLRCSEEELPVALFSPTSPRFLRWMEEDRLMRERIDPWPEL